MHFTIEADLVYVRKQKDQLKSEKAESYFYFLEIRKKKKKKKEREIVFAVRGSGQRSAMRDFNLSESMLFS